MSDPVKKVVWGPLMCETALAIGSSVCVYLLVEGKAGARLVAFLGAGVFAVGAVMFAVVAALRIDRNTP